MSDEGLHYVSTGEIEPDEADEMNIPVNIWLTPPGRVDNEAYGDTHWSLSADNFMPRRSRVAGEQYEVWSRDRDVLVAIVHRHWLPLYKVAVKLLEEMAPDDDGTAALYYWEERVGERGSK